MNKDFYDLGFLEVEVIPWTKLAVLVMGLSHGFGRQNENSSFS